MTNRHDWLKEITLIAQQMTPDEYEDGITTFQERGISMVLLKKVIFQDHQNPTNEAMETALNGYFSNHQQDEDFKNKLALVLYEFKQSNLDKFNEFVQKYGGE